MPASKLQRKITAKHAMSFFNNCMYFIYLSCIAFIYLVLHLLKACIDLLKACIAFIIAFIYLSSNFEGLRLSHPHKNKSDQNLITGIDNMKSDNLISENYSSNRCWCVENDGRTRDRKFLTRFSYKKFGQILYCTPPIHPISPNVLPKTPQSQKEAMLEDQNTNSSIPSSQAANAKPVIPPAPVQNQTGNAQPSLPSAQLSTAKP